MTEKTHRPRIAVTGINGFVGKHLARELFKHDVDVVGLGMDTEAAAAITECVGSYHQVDLTREWPEMGEIDAVIHLAGLAAVGASYQQPQHYLEVNSAMVTHMAEYYLKKAERPRLVIISSGAIYDASFPMPLTEDAAVDFSSPYAVSKVLIENQSAYYRSRGLNCVVMRPFNHIGPGQKAGFLVPDLVEKLRALQPAGGEIEVGNLTTKRDFTDVRDVVRAYRMIATAETLGSTIYNVCSGKSVAGEIILKELENIMQLSNKVKVVQAASNLRPNDVQDIYGSAARLHRDVGWKPAIPLAKTLEDLLKIAR